MVDAYATAKTYADRGRARETQVDETGESLRLSSFSTHLDRRYGFRLDTLRGRSVEQVVLWTGSGSARTFEYDRAWIDTLPKSLLFRCRVPASATRVASLLLPQEFSRSLLVDLHGVRYEGRQAVAAARCHRVFGRWRENTEILLWLDEDRYLVRRLVDRTEYPWAREAARLRHEQLGKREHALAAGISRDLLDQFFGAERILAIKHWPYARPRYDGRTITRVAYEPQVNVSLDPRLFRYKPRAV